MKMPELRLRNLDCGAELNCKLQRRAVHGGVDENFKGRLVMFRCIGGSNSPSLWPWTSCSDAQVLAGRWPLLLDCDPWLPYLLRKLPIITVAGRDRSFDYLGNIFVEQLLQAALYRLEGEARRRPLPISKASMIMAKEREQRMPPTVPKEFAGKWIAWNQKRTAIIGQGKTLPEAVQAAQAAGEADPGYEWVPPADRRIVGTIP